MRADQRIDAGDLDGLPIGDPPETGPDTRARTRPQKATRAEGDRYLVAELDDGRWQVTIVKPAGSIQHTGERDNVRVRALLDCDPRDRGVLAAALGGR